MSLKLTRKLGLPARRAGKLIIMRFGMDETHDINELALLVTYNVRHWNL